MASGITHRAMVWLGLTDDYEDYAPAYEEPAPVQSLGRRQVEAHDVAPVSVVRPVPRDPVDQGPGVSVTPRPSVVRPIAASPSARAHVVAPGRFGDAQEVGDRFKASQPVVVDLRDTDPKLSRRMLDFCSGVTYALGGSLDKMDEQVFLLTPSGVELSGEDKRRLEERGLYRA